MEKKQKLSFVEFTLEGAEGFTTSKGVVITTFRLIFDVNEIAEAEKITGLNLMFAMKHLESMSFGHLRGLLFGLMRGAFPTLTLSEAGSLLSVDTRTVQNAMWKVLEVEGADDPLLRDLQKLHDEDPLALVQLLAKVKMPAEAVAAAEAAVTEEVSNA